MVIYYWPTSLPSLLSTRESSYRYSMSIPKEKEHYIVKVKDCYEIAKRHKGVACGQDEDSKNFGSNFIQK